MRKRAFWRLLLLDKGQGWLRWSTDERTEYIHHGEGLDEPCPYVVAPPARRLWWWVKQIPMIPFVMLIGVRDGSRRYHFSWEEARPEDFKAALFTWYVDKDRHDELWETPKGWGRGR